MSASEAKTKQKRIEDLTLKEVDMIYSLARVGEWTDLEIGRRYCISQADVRKVVDNYDELRGAVQKDQHHERLPQEPSQELTTKERKRRSDARFATTAERQVAYRARLKEKRRASLKQASLANETDSSGPDVEEPSVTVCEVPITETSPENEQIRHSACDSSRQESNDISESVPLTATPEACSESEELRVIEE
jgi:hypothetical protein